MVDKGQPSKKNTTMVKLFTGSSGVAKGNEAKPSRYHLAIVWWRALSKGFI